MLNTSLPKILRHIGSAVTGVGFSDFVYQFFLNIFEVLFCGKTCLMINKKGLQIAEGDTFSMRIMILSYLWSFFGSKTLIVWSMPSMEIFSITIRSWWQLLSILVLNLSWNLIPASFLEIMEERKVLSYNLKSFAVNNKASLEF